MESLFKLSALFSITDKMSGPLQKIIKNFNGYEKMIEKGNAWQEHGQKMGLTAAVMGAAADKMNGAINSIKEPYMAVEDATLALSTVTTSTLGDMEKSMEMTKQKALEWSKSHRESAAKYIETTYQMASAGLTDVQAIAATETAMRTARATMGDSAEAAALIAVAYNNMGDKGADAEKEIGKLGDVITKTQQMFQIKNLNQLSEGLKYAIPTALQFGQSFEEINVAVGALNNAGLVGGQAGTAYAAAMRQMNKASKELGFTLARNAKGGIDFIGTLANINQKYGDFNRMAPEVQEKFKQAFGDEGLRTISLLASKTEDMKLKMKGVNDSLGAAAKAQETLEGSTSAKMEIAANKLDAVKIDFAERLLKSGKLVNEVIPKFSEIIESIAGVVAGFMDANPEIAAWATTAIMAIAAILPIVSLLVSFASAVVSLAGICATMFGKIWKIGYKLYLFWDSKMIPVLKGIGRHAGDALGKAKEWFVRAGDSAKNYGNKVMEAGQNAWNHLMRAADAAKKFATEMLDAAKRAAVELKDRVMAAGQSAWKHLMRAADAAKRLATNMLEAAGRAARHLGAKIAEAGRNAWIHLTDAANAAKAFGNKIWEAGKKAAIAAATGLKAAAKGVLAFAKQAWSAAATALPKLIAATWSWTVALLSNPVTWIVLAIVAAVALLIYYWDDLKAAGIAAWNYLSEAAGNAWNSLNGIIDGMIASVVQVGQTLWNTFAETFPGVASFIDSMQSTFFTSGAALWDAFCNGIQSVLSKPAELVREGLQMIRNMLPFSDAKEGPLSQLTKSGRAVMATIAEGVPDSYGTLQAAVATGFEGIDLQPGLPVNPDWNLEGVPSVPEVVIEPALNMDALRSVMPVQPEPGRSLAALASVQKVPVEADWYVDPLAKVPVEADWFIDPLAKMPEIPKWGMDPAWMQGTGFMPEKPEWQMPDAFETVTPRREQQPRQAVQIQKEGRKIIIYGDIHIQTQQMNNANDFMEALKVIADSEGDGDAD